MVASFKQMFNENAIPSSSLLVEGDHPELDMSDYLSAKDITKYQSLVESQMYMAALLKQ